jgi:hypothetical protein
MYVYVYMAILLVHWSSWSCFYLSGCDCIDILRVRMSGYKLNAVRSCVAAQFSYDAWCGSRVVVYLHA